MIGQMPRPDSLGRGGKGAVRRLVIFVPGIPQETSNSQLPHPVRRVIRPIESTIRRRRAQFPGSARRVPVHHGHSPELHRIVGPDQT